MNQFLSSGPKQETIDMPLGYILLLLAAVMLSVVSMVGVVVLDSRVSNLKSELRVAKEQIEAINGDRWSERHKIDLMDSDVNKVEDLHALLCDYLGVAYVQGETITTPNRYIQTHKRSHP